MVEIYVLYEVIALPTNMLRQWKMELGIDMSKSFVDSSELQRKNALIGS